MAKKTYRGVSRGRRLNKTELAKYQRLRKQLEEELPPAKANPMKIAVAKLRAMREAQGVSLSELATRTGMTRGNIARLESQKNATLQTLARYARGLDCDLVIDVVAADVKRRRKRQPV